MGVGIFLILTSSQATYESTPFVAISVAIYRGAQVPDIENSRKMGPGQSAGKTAEKQPKSSCRPAVFEGAQTVKCKP